MISKVEVKGGLPKGVTPDPGATPSTFTAQTGKDGVQKIRNIKLAYLQELYWILKL